MPTLPHYALQGRTGPSAHPPIPARRRVAGALADAEVHRPSDLSRDCSCRGFGVRCSSIIAHCGLVLASATFAAASSRSFRGTSSTLGLPPPAGIPGTSCGRPGTDEAQLCAAPRRGTHPAESRGARRGSAPSSAVHSATWSAVTASLAAASTQTTGLYSRSNSAMSCRCIWVQCCR